MTAGPQVSMMVVNPNGLLHSLKLELEEEQLKLPNMGGFLVDVLVVKIVLPIETHYYINIYTSPKAMQEASYVTQPMKIHVETNHFSLNQCL